MAANVHAAILARHADDLIVGECKDGPTWGGSHLRLDYWVLRRSWTKPAMIGYEVKSGRADFLADKKWQGYLPLCNELWFIAEGKKAIQPEELPESVGLLRLAGSRLITVRKAVWREIACPESLLTYILMCRASVKTEYERQPQTDRWRAWLAQKEEKREIGVAASRGLRELYARDVQKVQSENAELRSRIESADRLRSELEAAGVNWRSYMTARDVAEELNAPRWTRQQVEATHKELGKLLETPDGR